MNAKNFLVVGGIVLILVGILGFVDIIGPNADKSIFGKWWWFDDPENYAHTILGIVALLAAFVLPTGGQKFLVYLVGIVGVLIGIYSLLGYTSFLGANLENPADSILHIVIGLWALMSAMKTKTDNMAPAQPV